MAGVKSRYYKGEKMKIKYIALFILLYVCSIYSQSAMKFVVIGDTTDLKTYKNGGIVLLLHYGNGNNLGGGSFQQIDFTYAEGANAFGSYYSGYQWARINLVDQYIRPSTSDNYVLILKTNAYTPVSRDSLWNLIYATK